MNRGERRYRTARIVRRQACCLDDLDIIDLHPSFYAENSIYYRECDPHDNAKRIGRCKKTKAYDCGHTRCFICGNGKYWGQNGRRPTVQEVKAQINFRCQMNELGLPSPRPLRTF